MTFQARAACSRSVSRGSLAQTKAKAHCSGRLITFSRHIPCTCPERSPSASICAVALSLFVSYVQINKNSPKTPEDVAWHEALCSSFSASACARWRWREPSESAPLLADAASGMLLKLGLTVRAFIPKERGGDAAVF